MGSRFNTGHGLILTIIVCGVSFASVADEPPSLRQPVDCQLGNDCWIVNHVDRDSGTGVQDFMCSQFSYDGHKGVDFAIRDLAAMDDGVAVVASAGGVVQGVRNHMDDVNVNKLKDEVWAGLDCGNGMVIQHEGGWETQYCHMRRGSVIVAPGQRVAAGDVLGFVGNSGRAAFPHLHLSVRHDGQVIDPFAPGPDPEDPSSCISPSTVDPLWNEAFMAELPRSMTALYAHGFASSAIKPDEARAGQYETAKPHKLSPVLAFWADIYWIAGQDNIDVRIIGPDESVFAEHSVAQSHQQVRRFILVGKKRKTEPWPTGVYSGEIKVTRTLDDGSVQEFHQSGSVEIK